MSGQEPTTPLANESGTVEESVKQTEEHKPAAQPAESPTPVVEVAASTENTKPTEEKVKSQEASTPAAPTETPAEVPTQAESHTGGVPIVKDVGVSADRNARHRRFMEDAHTSEPNLTGDNKHGFFGVYDGHGGKSAALFCQSHLHKILSEELNSLPEGADSETVKQALKNAYSKTDIAMKEVVPSAGACVVTCLVRQEGDKRFLYIGNAGDARAVLSRKGVAKRLTIDHKPTNEDEAERISQAGGFISNGRVNGMVAITRSLGDHCMKDFISGEPYLDYLELIPGEDNLLILACDGVWDVLSDQDAIDLIEGEPDCTAMSKKLLIHAIKGGSTDNISVMVVAL
eukprot:TRINITY_DN3005_c0_g1_i1.p1 TRINITY_DN3005_c0_g1~~TRINITY_DN3005_c0_g1_i1.p1  ORF type:complete len:344 (+),score=79.64 TRINITY_DN3005_c0_g1_i1:111-1142(+)